MSLNQKTYSIFIDVLLSDDIYKSWLFQKHGKFKEDQIVKGMVSDDNGIPLHL
ncbi:hypothetical protein HYD56_00875 [Mycoplasmopsis bovis]|nr:hypothetical protein HYD56_00875 [Mycoplasmopsis bovis]